MSCSAKRELSAVICTGDCRQLTSSTDLRTQLATANEATRTASTKLAEAESALEGRIAEATQPLRTQIASFDEERLKLKSAGLSWQKQFRNLRDTDLPKLQHELDSTRTQLEGKNGEVQTLQQQLGDAQGEKTTLEGKIKEVEAKVVAVTRAEGLKEQTVQRLQSELSKKAAAGDVVSNLCRTSWTVWIVKISRSSGFVGR